MVTRYVDILLNGTPGKGDEGWVAIENIPSEHGGAALTNCYGPFNTERAAEDYVVKLAARDAERGL